MESEEIRGSGRICSLSMDAPAPCCLSGIGEKYHGESQAAQGSSESCTASESRSAPQRRPDTGVDIRQNVSDLSQRLTWTNELEV